MKPSHISVALKKKVENLQRVLSQKNICSVLWNKTLFILMKDFYEIIYFSLIGS